MQWMRFDYHGATGFGVLEGERVRRFQGDMFETALATDETFDLAAVRWLPPCQPGKIIGLWNNFRAAAEKNGWAQPVEPLYFLKSPGSISAHLQPIAVPASYGGRVVYEGELVVVIGKTAHAVSVQDAAAHIFGYSCGNDLTALELLHSDASFAQWTRAKSFDGFAAFGPVIETDFNPATAQLRTLVGGRERQNYALSDMFFSPLEIVSRLSHDMTLQPGDIIYCGTSLGVLPMKTGTTVEVVIDGISTLSNLYG
jgi:2-keto-4-pentenoate hydratase/2-oxohepta-3-ene-1,7-dioic acid hydratase in catechol pathway